MALVSIDVTPTSPNIAKGTTQQFTATGTYTDHSTQDLTGSVTWGSNDPSVATVSNDSSSHGLTTGAAVGATTITAAYGGITGSAKLTVSAATLVSIGVTPPSPSIAKGTTQQFTATGTFTDSTTQNMTASVTWSSSDTSVATISNASDSNGLATGAGVGAAPITITATYGSISGSTSLMVNEATLVSIGVTPALPTLAKGTTQQFAATGIFSDSTFQDLTDRVTWSSSDTSVATISNAPGTRGLTTGASVGESSITATYGGISGSTSLTVTAATLVSIGVTPASPSIAKGTTQQFTATGTYTDGTTQDLTGSVTWNSSDTSIATISNASGTRGLASGMEISSTPITITAIHGTVSGSTSLTVTAATLVSIGVTPASSSIAKGTTQQFTATGTYTDGTTQDLTGSVTWSSSDTSIATISNASGSKGLATGAGTSATPITITATSGPISGSTSLTVTAATLVSIGVTPASSSIAKGTTQQFTATGTYTDGTTQDLTDSVTWSSSDASIATISNASGSHGLATGAAIGTITITATYGGISGSNPLTVGAATLVFIGVTPAAPSIAKGNTQQFTATGTYTDGTTQNLTGSVTWSSSDTSVATISNTSGSHGLATGAGVGTSSITATQEGISGSASLTVSSAALVSIGVTPAAPNIAKGNTQQFTATGTYTDGTTQDLTSSVTWSSGDTSVATISNTSGSHGLATGTGVGASSITAAHEGISGSASLTVSAATLVSIGVTPALSSIPKATTRQFTATGIYTDSTTQDLTSSVTWSSSDTGVVGISNAAGSKGLVAGMNVSATPITIMATLGGFSGSTTLTVNPELVYSNTSPVSVTAADLLVVGGLTLTVNASALTGSNTFTWNGAAELDGSFYFKAGSSAATLTGGAGNDVFDFTVPGVTFSISDYVNGSAGNDALKIGQVDTTTALNNVSNIETISFADNASVSITTANSLVAPGATLTVDASALTGTHTFTWTGSAEADGSFHITAGSSDASIVGGIKADVINGGTGSNVIDGGPGSDTINLGTHTGVDTIKLNNLKSGADTISGFMATGAPHDVIYVSVASGLYFVASDGGNVAPGASAVAKVVTTSGPLRYSSCNMLILADVPYANADSVVTALETGGANELTLSHSIGRGGELLVAYSDGINAHLIGITINPSDTVSAESTSSSMVYTDLATIRAVTPNELALWTGGNFHF